MDLGIAPVDECVIPITTTALDLTWSSERAFTFEGTLYQCIKDAFEAQTDVDAYKTHVVAALVMSQAKQHHEMASTLIRMRNQTIEETDHDDDFWIDHMPGILAAVGRDLHADGVESRDVEP